LRLTPEFHADEFDGSEIVVSILVVAHGYASELLDTIEETLGGVSLSIEPRGGGEALVAIGAVGDADLHLPWRTGCVAALP